MKSHRAIMEAAGRAVCDSEAVYSYCFEKFGTGLNVHVGSYAAATPTEEDAPFLMIFAEGDSESVGTDEDFVVSFIVGACPVTSTGARVAASVVKERNAEQNGLVINGLNAVVEDLRDIILSAIRNAAVGARVVSFARVENDSAHQPLEWAAFSVTFRLDVSLDDPGE